MCCINQYDDLDAASDDGNDVDEDVDDRNDDGDDDIWHMMMSLNILVFVPFNSWIWWIFR